METEEKQKINILIGTPAYNGMVHIDYLNSILDTINKVPFTVINIGNESLITRARNKIITYFHEHKEFSHLLFLDGDIGINGSSILKLISHNKDVIGAPVPMKGLTPEGQKIYNVTEILEQDEETKLYKVKHVGTAVFMLSRKAVEDLIKQSDKYTHRGEQGYDVFKVGVKEDIYLSEDFWVCNELQALGYNIFVDDTIEVKHNGTVQF
jgi:hypothetical protein